MNKKALKEFAVYARNELRSQIALRAQAFGITPKGSPVLVTGADYVDINGKQYPINYKNSIQMLLKEIETKGYDSVIEEAAYTWFNRLIAIRYMEVHNYLPSKVRVLSSEIIGKVDPDLLTEYQYTDLPVDKEEMESLLSKGSREEAFRKLLIAECNELNQIMPFLFEKLSDFTEMLLPESLLHADSLINKLGKELEDEMFDNVEVIGWLYQYYISEKKDEVFAGLKKNQKITKENIPAATQLFTPHWIVRYMVENTLGHMWVESFPQSSIKSKLHYYLEQGEQDQKVLATLNQLIDPNLSPEEITILDPACGSGHILVYAFDLLYEIYEERGYSPREIPTLILEKNLFGIDIDDRVAQLASFALLMKAREKTKHIFRSTPKLNIISIQESNGLNSDQVANFIGQNDQEKMEIKALFTATIDAKNFGSILKPFDLEFNKYIHRIKELRNSGQQTLDNYELYEQIDLLEQILIQANFLSKQYDIVITNPPYMGTKGMNPQLAKYVKDHYKDSKADLFATFMERCNLFTKTNGFHSEVNQHSWMFLSSYEELRKNIYENTIIQSMVHLGPRTFEEIGGEVVQSTTFVLRKKSNDHYIGRFIRLVDYHNPLQKEEQFFNLQNQYLTRLSELWKIPGFPLAYWATSRVREIFSNYPSLEEFAEPRQGMATSDNNRFLRHWHEVPYNNIGFGYSSNISAQESNKMWFPYNKGGDFRKWYGNQEYVINWKNDGQEVKDYAAKLYKSYTRTIKNIPYYFREGITWSFISSSRLGLRYTPKGFIFDVGGSSAFPEETYLYYLSAFLISKVAHQFLQYLNPTMNFQVGNIKALPIIFSDSIKDRVDKLAKDCINYSKYDWDSFETSWEFKKHPFLNYLNEQVTLENCFNEWAKHTQTQFRLQQKNEEELNQLFIDLYGLQNEITTPEVQNEEVTLYLANRERDAKSFLSYCIGLMMGRYSLDEDGLVFASGEWNSHKFKKFQPDSDGIIPLSDTEYFEDDIVSRLQELLVIIFGQSKLSKNLSWLAESLTLKANETPVERLRRYFFDEFYSDHCKIYQKRPIYWMTESGPKKGFRALFYLHRYTTETMANIRFSYVQNLQEKLRQEQLRLEQDIANQELSSTVIKRYEKQLSTIKVQQVELVNFDKKLAEVANQRIALDLDDGVLINYDKLKTALAKIK